MGLYPGGSNVWNCRPTAVKPSESVTKQEGSQTNESIAAIELAGPTASEHADMRDGCLSCLSV